MSKSARLRLGEVRAAFRLVGECRDLGYDPDGWPARLVAGLPALVPGQMLLAGEFVYRGLRPVPVRVAEAGWPSERSRALWQGWVRNPAMPEHPGLAAFAAKPDRRGVWTRAELVSDREWEASPHVNEVLRPAGIDEGMLSGVPTGTT